MIGRLPLFTLLLFSVAVHAQDRAAISGVVTLSNSGEVLPDAVVTIQLNTGILRIGGVAMGNPIKTTLDRTGKFLFKDITPGTYQLTIDRAGSPGFVDNKRTITVFARSDSVEPAAAPLTLSVAFPQVGTVAGAVRDQSGKLVAGVPILLLLAVEGPPQFVLGGRTDAHGEYRLTDVPPGKFRILARPDMILPVFNGSHELIRQNVSTFYSKTTADRNGSVISLLGGEEIKGVDITLQSSIL